MFVYIVILYICIYLCVSGDCHKRDNANSNRDNVVYQIRKAGFRVEGLGRCMHTKNPEGTSLHTICTHARICTCVNCITA
jgi:hypothetical protein